MLSLTKIHMLHIFYMRNVVICVCDCMSKGRDFLIVLCLSEMKYVTRGEYKRNLYGILSEYPQGIFFVRFLEQLWNSIKHLKAFVIIIIPSFKCHSLLLAEIVFFPHFLLSTFHLRLLNVPLKEKKKCMSCSITLYFHFLSHNIQ